MVAQWAAPSVGQIVLSQDFDSGSLNVLGSSVIGDQVMLQPRYTWTDPSFDSSYRWIYFRADGVQNSTPQFSVDAFSFLGSLSGHRYRYSYDQSQWHLFDSNQIVGSDYVFGNQQPFTQDTVYVAYGLPYPVSRTQSFVDSIQSSPFVTPTSSGAGDFVVGQTAGGIDDMGRTVAPQDLLAFHVTDPTAVGPKAKILLAAGAHSAETMGNYGLEGFVKFLLSDDLRASQLRSRAEFFVYPQVNPDGRIAGYYRSDPENPDRDFNRFYNDPGDFTGLSIVTAAMQSDTAGDVDYLFDFHSWWGPWTGDNFLFTVNELTNSPFVQELVSLEPDFGISSSAGHPGMLRIWGMSAAGLNADFAYTPEFGFHADVDPQRMDLYGQNMALALREVLGAPLACDLDADGACGLADIDLLTVQGDLVAGATLVDPKFDLNGDGNLDQQDLLVWLATAAAENGLPSPYLLGDGNLDGFVDVSDFNLWLSHRFTGDSVWRQGDFNGDGVSDLSDFNLWNSHKFTSSFAVVPEPDSSRWIGVWLAWLVVFLLWQRRPQLTTSSF